MTARIIMRHLLVFGFLAASHGLVGSAAAAPVLSPGAVAFDPDGSGMSGAFSGVSRFDFEAGNALGIGAVPALTGRLLDFALQTRLATFFDGSINRSLPAGGEITMTMRATTQVMSVAGPTVNTSVVPGSGFLNLYFDATPDANAGSGTGFDDGALILSATMLGGNMDVTDTRVSAPFLDSVAGSGPPTLGLTGNAALNVLAAFVDPTFFLTTPTAATFTTTLSTPFALVPRSTGFPAFGVTPNLGTTNGLSGPDVQLQSNSELTFLVIPEPATLWLVGVACLGLLASRRVEPAAPSPSSPDDFRILGHSSCA